uniref:Uncharacterized protein n=1 Tax=Fagus sylvatica TaxID=28930 RepID=A0A2N9G5P9_FAGSY
MQGGWGNSGSPAASLSFYEGIMGYEPDFVWSSVGHALYCFGSLGLLARFLWESSICGDLEVHTSLLDVMYLEGKEYAQF